MKISNCAYRWHEIRTPRVSSLIEVQRNTGIFYCILGKEDWNESSRQGRATTHCSTIFSSHMVNQDGRSTFCMLAPLTTLISGRFRFGSMNPTFSTTARIPIP
ncbi:hypothetical protein PHMEG_00033005 [Phytophthora megakarya]|uniref:Uncharacterized protein n=1 Tax=Phytophthora megakarya TaxID=4795 RepID=A0A225UUQ5_9STRA|nr:hypothetical protein PHMEG_00033005 [Phytophthora megakarya]